MRLYDANLSGGRLLWTRTLNTFRGLHYFTLRYIFGVFTFGHIIEGNRNCYDLCRLDVELRKVM